MTIQACIFDLDGVIVDSAKFHFLAWRRLAKTVGFDFTETHNHQLKGVSRHDSLVQILEWADHKVSDEEFQTLMDRKNGWYLEFIATMAKDEILPGVSRFLGELKEAGIKIALGSSSKNARRILSELNIEHFFDSIVDGTNVTRFKPDPEVFEIGATELGCPPEACVVFEDALAGIQAAIDGGFIAVGVGIAEELPNAPQVIPGFCDFGLRELRSLS